MLLFLAAIMPAASSNHGICCLTCCFGSCSRTSRHLPNFENYYAALCTLSIAGREARRLALGETGAESCQRLLPATPAHTGCARVVDKAGERTEGREEGCSSDCADVGHLPCPVPAHQHHLPAPAGLGSRRRSRPVPGQAAAYGCLGGFTPAAVHPTV